MLNVPSSGRNCDSSRIELYSPFSSVHRRINATLIRFWCTENRRIFTLQLCTHIFEPNVIVPFLRCLYRVSSDVHVVSISVSIRNSNVTKESRKHLNASTFTSKAAKNRSFNFLHRGEAGTFVPPFQPRDDDMILFSIIHSVEYHCLRIQIRRWLLAFHESSPPPFSITHSSPESLVLGRFYSTRKRQSRKVFFLRTKRIHSYLCYWPRPKTNVENEKKEEFE